MKKINDITLMHYAEGILKGSKNKEIKALVASNKEFKQKVKMFKKTLSMLTGGP